MLQRVDRARDDDAEHGGQRKNPGEYCATCHHRNEVNEARSPKPEGRTIYVHSTDLKRMIHKIHMGDALTQPYELGGFGGPIDFGHVRYPSSRANCAACHLDGTHTLPMPIGLGPTIEELRTCVEDPAADANDTCEPADWIVAQTYTIGPEQAACASCHDSPATQAHADIMTTPDGRESCATCHGPGAGYDVDVVH